MGDTGSGLTGSEIARLLAACGLNDAGPITQERANLLIRDGEEDARKLFVAQMEHNRTPLSRVENDAMFWVGTPEQIAERMRRYRALGFDTFIAEIAAPCDDETIERWIGEVKPIVEG